MSSDATPARFTPGGPAASRPVKKLAGECVSFEDDLVVVEEPLEIRVGGASIAVTMRTPGNDRELAAGFCLTEGIVLSPDEIESIEICPEATHANIMDVTLAPEAGERNASRVCDAKRQLYLSSSCGLCGRQTIERVFQNIPPISSEFQISRTLLEKLPDGLRQAQPTFNKTGGLHGVALFDTQGNLIVTREDIGRHNAVDKVIGHQALLNRWPISQAGLLVSGRAGFEIIQKAAIAGISVIAAVGAPSSLAVDACVRLDITLVGFLRPGRMNVYAGQRVV
jgi:FdhD protein